MTGSAVYRSGAEDTALGVITGGGMGSLTAVTTGTVT
jgi:hypothetical protein